MVNNTMITSISITSASQSFSAFSCAQAKAIDQGLMGKVAYGSSQSSGLILMQRAAKAAFDLMTERWVQLKSLIVFCGSGNNAGDAYELARLAALRGYEISLYFLGDPERLSSDAKHCRLAAEKAGVVHLIYDEKSVCETLLDKHNRHCLIIDGLLGVGKRGSLREEYRECIRLINHSEQPVFALDIPSGLNGDNGSLEPIAIQAELTLSFLVLKKGLLTGDACECVGELYLNELGESPLTVASELGFLNDSDSTIKTALTTLLSYSECRKALPKRKSNSHKGNHGRVLIIAGAKMYGGAGILSAQAALCAGAGLVSLATHERFVAPMLARCPEVMVHALPDKLNSSDLDDLMTLVKVSDSIVIGPGLSQTTWGRAVFERFCEYLDTESSNAQSYIFDADGLNLLAQASVSDLPAFSVLTPHPGEAARLLNDDVFVSISNKKQDGKGLKASHIQQARFDAVQALQEKYSACIVLKGAGTLVAHREQRVDICPYGNPAMAVGGMGDVLSGLIAALLVQMDDKNAAVDLAVCVHSLAADNLVLEQGEIGVRASELVLAIRKQLNQPIF